MYNCCFSENVIFSSVSHVDFFVGEEPKSIAKMDGGYGQIGPLDPPLHVEQN